MRVKVVLGTKKVVVPVPPKANTIADLSRCICERLKIDRLSEVRLSDGFLLDFADPINEALVNDDILVCIDYAAWLKERAGDITRAWFTSYATDYSDPDYNLKIQLGYSQNQDSIYLLAFSKKNDYYDIAFVPIYDLTTKYKGTSVIDISNYPKNDGGANYGVSSHLIIEDGIVQFVELRNKSPTDENPRIHRIALTYKNSNKTVESNGSTLIQGPLRRPGSSVPALPAAVVTGPSFDEVKENPRPDSTGIIVDTKAPITIKSEGRVDINQSWASDGVFRNIFSTDFELLVAGNNPIIITDLKATYKAKDGEWKAVDLISYKYGYQWNDDFHSFKIAPEEPTCLSLCSIIRIKAAQADKLRRIHGSLPDPLHLRYILTSSTNEVITIETIAYNPPRDLTTRHYVEKNKVNDGFIPLQYLECDDIETETRNWALFCKSEPESTEYGPSWELLNSLSSSTTRYYADEINKLLYKLKKDPSLDTAARAQLPVGYQLPESTQLVSVEEWSTTSSSIDHKLRSWLMVNVDSKSSEMVAYGVLMFMSTLTSSTIRSAYLFPK